MDRINQANMAGFELKQIDQQIITQKIRIELAQNEIDNQQVQIDQAKEAEEFVKSKFTNEQLYKWMSDELKDLYYQTYSFAYDLAKKAEKVFRFDMGLSTSDIVKFGYWDSSKEGFLVGEQLYLALKQLENTYIETRSHDYEVTKNVSLNQINPLALIQLKEQGVCEFDVSEDMFDLDFPGHYKRRIKTVSITLPCVVGPYTSINGNLRLLKHEYRNSNLSANYSKNIEEADERFVVNNIPVTAIAVSHGQDDSGVFELSFKDERYLPFEGAGAISRWRFELQNQFRQFDYQTINDVIVHIRYTSSEGGEILKSAALDNLDSYVNNAEQQSKEQGLFRLFSLAHEFPNEWHQFISSSEDSRLLVLGDIKSRLPFFAKSNKINATNVVDLRLFTSQAGLELNVLKNLQMQNLTSDLDPVASFESASEVGQLSQYVAVNMSEDIEGFWALQVQQANLLDLNSLRDAWLVVKYTIA